MKSDGSRPLNPLKISNPSLSKQTGNTHRRAVHNRVHLISLLCRQIRTKFSPLGSPMHPRVSELIEHEASEPRVLHPVRVGAEDLGRDVVLDAHDLPGREQHVDGEGSGRLGSAPCPSGVVVHVARRVDQQPEAAVVVVAPLGHGKPGNESQVRLTWGTAFV